MGLQLEISPEVFNPVYLRYMLNNQHRTQIYYGGSSSGKSYAKAQCLVLDILAGNRNYLVTRNVARTLRQSCFNEITKAISAFEVTDYFSINKSDMVITCKINGKQVLFAGLDDPEKIKSITPASGVITDIWVEEATECDRNAIKQLDKRLRGKSNVRKRLVLTFNPVLQSHWIHSEYFDIWQNDKQYCESAERNLSILKTTYKDNLFLEPDDIKALENETDPYYHNVYTLGNWGVLGAIIFKNWKVEDFSELRKTFDSFRHGVDWGFGTDPFAYAKVYYDKTRKRLYICDEVYSCGLLNEQAAEAIRSYCGSDRVICDSAEPKSITEMRQKYRINAIGAKKGPGSIEHGIKFLQGLEIIIDSRCQNAKNEFSTYKYKEDKLGNALPIPLDKNNHLIDAIRYCTEDLYREISSLGASGSGNERNNNLADLG
jgi:phage terminase large subunit